MAVWQTNIIAASADRCRKEEETMNNILLINDMAGYGKVALSAMIPIMSNMKFQVYNLPTALVSNTLDYGKFDILETTGYMKNSMRVWGVSLDLHLTP